MSAAALRLVEREAMPRAGTVPPFPLELDRVCFSAGASRLIDDLSLVIGSGSRTVVLGPNGAGKSLLLRLCHGLIRPTSGRIRWAESDLATLRREQAFVFQRPVLLRRSVAANVAYALAVNGVPRRERARRVAAALAEVGLAALGERPARVLSGGEQQRLALARAWALEPRVLFLDEPTANLDPAATRIIETVIADMHARGVKVIMTTHDLGQAKRHADEVVFLHRGRLIEHTSADIFFHEPRSREARAFVAGDLLW
jgi:tungstate transport system ATP-binding protein